MYMYISCNGHTYCTPQDQHKIERISCPIEGDACILGGQIQPFSAHLEHLSRRKKEASSDHTDASELQMFNVRRISRSYTMSVVNLS